MLIPSEPYFKTGFAPFSPKCQGLLRHKFAEAALPQHNSPALESAGPEPMTPTRGNNMRNT